MTLTKDLVTLKMHRALAEHLGDVVTTGISAAGTTQGTATALTGTINIVETVTATERGLILPTALDHARKKITVINLDADNNLDVYPATGETIDGAAANTSALVSSGKARTFYRVSETAWYTDNDFSYFNGPVSFLGNITLGGNLICTGYTSIINNTSDGSDNGYMVGNGGGAASTARGAGFLYAGNEEGTYTGQARRFSGDVSTGHVIDTVTHASAEKQLRWGTSEIFTRSTRNAGGYPQEYYGAVLEDNESGLVRVGGYKYAGALTSSWVTVCRLYLKAGQTFVGHAYFTAGPATTSSTTYYSRIYWFDARCDDTNTTPAVNSTMAYQGGTMGTAVIAFRVVGSTSGTVHLQAQNTGFGTVYASASIVGAVVQS